MYYQQILVQNKTCRSQAREQGLATMLFCVVAVFFVCNLLALVVNILEVIKKILEKEQKSDEAY